jgi:hypothetical protein
MFVTLMLQVLLLLGLLAVCGIGPGLYFVRYLHWKPQETLCASVTASMGIIYLASLAIYLLHMPPEAHWVFTGFCLVMTLACGRDLLRLVARRQVRRMLAALGILMIWTLLLLSVIRHYGGAAWFGDWYEHYDRSKFFLQDRPLNTRFLGIYSLTARPPLMNLVCAHFLAQMGTDFAVYQIVASLLNLLPVLPCCLFACSVFRRQGGDRSRVVSVLILFLAASPMFMQNVTFVWTKPFTAFFDLTALWLYLRGWVKEDHGRMIMAFVFGAAGCLAHFSALTWIAPLAAHYLFFVWPWRKSKWGELAAIALCGGGFMATWFAWAMYAFGWSEPFRSNTTSSAVAGNTAGGYLAVIAGNFLTTFIPHFITRVSFAALAQTDPWGTARDWFFTLYQTNAIFALGSMGAVSLIAAWRAGLLPCGKGRGKRSMTAFWGFFLILSAIFSVVVTPTPENWGAAHLGLQPHVLLLLGLLAGALASARSAWRYVPLMGCAADFILGILLQVHLENRVFQIAKSPEGEPEILMEDRMPNNIVLRNYLGKEASGPFFGDGFAEVSPEMEIGLCVGFIFLSAKAARALRRGSRAG